MKTSIYVNYHKPAQIVPNNTVLVPIQVGRATSKNILNMLGDDTGDHISEKNSSYCELTGQYWVWKNDCTADYIGFVHYRRHFDFSQNHDSNVGKFGVIEEERISIDFLRKYGLDDASIENTISGFDIVLPKKWSVKNVGCKSIRQHYATAPSHHIKDLDIIGKIIREKYPEYWPHFDRISKGNEAYFTNMFIMRNEIFREYTEWLFDILEESEKQISIEGYDTAEKRVFGYLAERLLGTFVEKKKAENKTLKVLELNRVFVSDTEPRQLYPILSKDLDKIVIASVADNAYAPHLGVLLISILENSLHDRQIDFVVLDGGISTENKLKLSKLSEKRKKTSIHFVELSDAFSDVPVNTYFSKATFFRIWLPQLIPAANKVLYLDSDMVVLDDVAKIYDTELGDNYLAAVPDLIMKWFVNVGVRSLDKTGSMPAKKYLTNYLGLKNNGDSYFQAGTLVLNLAKLRNSGFSVRLTSLLKDKPFWFLDQDVLNIEFSHKYIPLCYDWNVINSSEQALSSLDDDNAKKLTAALKAPKIIHYAGFEAKPWNNLNAPMSDYYLYYLRKTFWYESILNSHRPAYAEYGASKSYIRVFAERVWLKLPPGMKSMLQGPKSVIKRII